MSVQNIEDYSLDMVKSFIQIIEQDKKEKEKEKNNKQTISVTRNKGGGFTITE
ncbi:MAG: hypothetical protein QXF12_06160 [Candidatus Aenigmatarchaeota archaeon]